MPSVLIPVIFSQSRVDLDKLIDSSGVDVVVRQVGLGVLGGRHELHGCVEKAGDPHDGTENYHNGVEIERILPVSCVVWRVFSVWMLSFICMYSLNSKLYSLVHLVDIYIQGTYTNFYVVCTIVSFKQKSEEKKLRTQLFLA